MLLDFARRAIRLLIEYVTSTQTWRSAKLHLRSSPGICARLYQVCLLFLSSLAGCHDEKCMKTRLLWKAKTFKLSPMIIRD